MSVLRPGSAAARLFALACLAAVASCRQDGVQACKDLVAAKRYAAAVEQCERIYANEKDPTAGVQAALAHYYLGHFEKVLAWQDRLVRAGRIPPGISSLAAAVHQQQGDFERAEREYRFDLPALRDAGDHRRLAGSLYRLYYISWYKHSSHRQTFLLASQALEEAAKAGDHELEALAAQAVYSVLFQIGDLQGAQRALEVARGLVNEQEPVARARFLNNAGPVLLAEGRTALARRQYEQALLLLAKGDSNHELLRGIHLNLAEVDLELGDLDRAEQDLAAAARHFEAAQGKPSSWLYCRARIDLARGKLATASRSLTAALSQQPEPEWVWRLEFEQGRVAEASGDLRRAEAAYSRSIATVEEMRRSLAFDELKSWLLDDKRQPFEALFRLQARTGRAKDALATAERAQSRTFLDAFLHATSSTGTATGQLWSPGGSLERVEGLESLLSVMSESPVAALQPIDQVLTALGDRHALVYFEAGEELWLIRLVGGRPHLLPLAEPASEVRRLAGRFLAHPEDAPTAERLGAVLLPPESLPEAGEPIEIVADGMLGNLPFAALRRSGRFLVEDYALVFAPSLGSLAALERRPGEALGPARVLADPRGDLPAAAMEGREVAGMLGATALTYGQATAAALRRASRAPALHLATHTGLGPSGPWLQLADGRVSASEIVAGRVGPRLVVLASCSSGVRPGRQMWGSLGAAFLAAGSHAVLASLWSVEDARARELVVRFYAAGGPSDPAGALARAQRVAIAQGLSPQDWGPFVLFGSDRPLGEIH